MKPSNMHFVKTFLAESDEQIQVMEDKLLELFNGKHDSQTLDVLYRAAHTIMNLAGMTNIESILNFLHIYQKVLSLMRDGKLTVDASLVTTLMDCCYHLKYLVNILVRQGGQLEGIDYFRESALIKRLQSYLKQADT